MYQILQRISLGRRFEGHQGTANNHVLLAIKFQPVKLAGDWDKSNIRESAPNRWIYSYDKSINEIFKRILALFALIRSSNK